jgi:hypothetical protein
MQASVSEVMHALLACCRRTLAIANLALAESSDVQPTVLARTAPQPPMLPPSAQLLPLRAHSPCVL